MRHLVPDAVLSELGRTGLGEPAARLFADAAHQRTLALLRTLLDGVDARTGDADLPGRLDGYWRVFQAAGRADPQAARRVLLYPAAGAWARHCLRGLRAGDPGLPADLEHLGALAAVAALRAGHPFHLELLPRGGLLTLPGLGAVRTPLPGRVAVSGDRDAVRIGLPGPGLGDVVVRRGWRPDTWRCADPRWLGLSVLPGATAVLDDLDPFRSRGGDGREPEERLGAAQRLRWRQLWGAATSLLARVDPRRGAEAEALVRCVVPLAPGGRPAVVAGAVYAALPGTAAQLAAVLVREIQLAKVAALAELAPLHLPPPGRGAEAEGGSAETGPAEPETGAGGIAGVYGRLALADFWQRMADAAADPAERAAAWAEHVRHWEHTGLPGAQALTPQGRVFVEAMAASRAALRGRVPEQRRGERRRLGEELPAAAPEGLA